MSLGKVCKPGEHLVCNWAWYYNLEELDIRVHFYHHVGEWCCPPPLLARSQEEVGGTLIVQGWSQWNILRTYLASPLVFTVLARSCHNIDNVYRVLLFHRSSLWLMVLYRSLPEMWSILSTIYEWLFIKCLSCRPPSMIGNGFLTSCTLDTRMGMLHLLDYSAIKQKWERIVNGTCLGAGGFW